MSLGYIISAENSFEINYSNGAERLSFPNDYFDIMMIMI